MLGTEIVEIPVLYRDEHLVAVHKPAGLLVHRNAHAGREPFLLQILRDQLGQRLYPVHRLDRPTSGLMIMALSPQAAHALALQFANQEVGKTYLAVTRGFAPPQGLIVDPLKSESGSLQEAQTEFTRLATAEIPHPVGPNPTARYSLVRACPRTGRTHQIRRHFAHIRHPLIGDVLRGDGRQNRFFRDHFGLHRLLLASVELTFHHPEDNSPMTLTCPPAKELLDLFDQLGWSAAIDAFKVQINSR
ncbi:pseudouridine synthase [Desulfomicrobium sp. ZS1]|uniref:pseudouridine synthase n=1 Tax=Desulfomicrobium sp. ZS1 TaxID=2952228 RepID=UPI0020B31F0D|nr:pseudouridine synthase [Desulfomicrobium sp. ZS1]UTF50143.1 pseudouridine synthase [Desulfomicrobium sp. ZS1]